METLYAITTGVLTACGLYLTLRGRTFPVVVGLTLTSYAVNLFLFSMGGHRWRHHCARRRKLRRPTAPGACSHGYRHRLRHDRVRGDSCHACPQRSG